MIAWKLRKTSWTVTSPPQGVKVTAPESTMAKSAMVASKLLFVGPILDDLHELPPKSSSHRLVAELVRHLPAGAHLVLCGRSIPPVPLAGCTPLTGFAASTRQTWLQPLGTRPDRAERRPPGVRCGRSRLVWPISAGGPPWSDTPGIRYHDAGGLSCLSGQYSSSPRGLVDGVVAVGLASQARR